MKKTYRLHIVSRDHKHQELALQGAAMFVAEPGSEYSVIDADTGAAAQGLVLKRQGQALVIENAEGPLARIDEFYGEGKAAAFDVGATGADGHPVLVTEASPAAPDTGTVWQPAADTTHADAAHDAGSLSPWLLGLGGGLGAVAALAGGGDGDTHYANSVSVSVVGGPVLATHALQVQIYSADGRLLDTATLGADGSLTVNVGEYRGVVIAKVAQDADSAPDYLDEATGAGKDLDVDLYATGVVAGSNATLHLNLNVLSTLAYHKAVESAGADPLAGGAALTAANVDNTNAAVATLFGLEDLHQTDIVTVNGQTSYDPANGVSASEKYGEVLAALSGADAANGGSTQATLDQLVAGITLTAASGTAGSAASVSAAFSDTAFQLVNQGADIVDQAQGTHTLSSVAADTAPSVLSVAVASATGAVGGLLNAGDVVTIAVRVSEAVIVSGTPQLAVQVGDSVVHADYAVGSGSNELRFTFVVQAGQSDADGIAIAADALALNGGSIVAADNAQALILGHAAVTDPNAYRVDTTTPEVSLTGATDDAGTITGALASGHTTDDTGLLLSGTCEAGASVKVYDGSTLLGSATVSGTGWSYTATVVDATTHQFHATATDAAGNTSASTAVFSVTGDTTAPSTGAGSLALSADSGASAADFITTHAAQTLSATLSAPLAADEALYGSTDGGATWTDISAMASGTAVSWTGLTLAGSGTLQLAVRDAAGQEGPVTSQAFVIDSVAPATQLGAATDDAGSLTGTLASGDRTDDTQLVLSGTCEAGASVKVYDGLTLLGSASVIGTAWTYTAAVADGTTYQFNTTATDVAGNTSAPTASFSVTGDTSAPALAFSAATDNVGAVTGALSSGQTTDDTSLVLSGTCEAGASVKVYDGLTLLGSALVSGTGWSYTATVADGSSYQFNATATDAAGNTSAATANFSVVGDTAAPSATLASVSDNAGTLTGALASGQTTDDTSLLLAGTCEAGASVKVYDGSTLLGSALVSGTSWSYTATVANGSSYQLNITATDAAGNTSAPSTSFAVSSDTSAPGVTLAAATDDVGSVTGAIASGHSSDDTSLVLSGTCEAGASVKVYDGLTLLGSALVSGTGWSYTATVVDGTTHQFNASATDAAGNTSAATANHTIVGDTSAPAVAFSAATDNVGAVTGTLISGQTTDDTSLVLLGTCEAGATVKVYDGLTLLGSALVSGTGWSYTATVVDGTTHQFNATATDAAGNSSAPSADFTVTGDTVAPTAPTALALTPVGGTVLADTLNSTNTHLSAQATIAAGEATGGKAELYIGNTLVATDNSIGSGDTSVSFSTSDGSPLNAELQAAVAAGGLATVRLYDAAGNHATSSVGNPTAVVDYLAPSANFGAANDDVGPVSGNLSNGAHTNDASLALSGTAEAGSTVHVYDGNTLLGDANVTGTSWSYSATVADGSTYQFNVTETDLHGNTSGHTADFTAIGDMTGPTASLSAASIAASGSASVQSSETGTLYLVDSSVTVNSLADITGAADAKWNSVNITSANQATSIAATGLADGTYHAYAVDGAGNLSSVSTDALTVTTPSYSSATVIFDMVHGVSSDHSSRSFDASTSYTIYVVVDGNSYNLNTTPSGAAQGATWGEWSNASALGADDKVVVVGMGSGGSTHGGTSSDSYFHWHHGNGGDNLVSLQGAGMLSHMVSSMSGIPGGNSGFSSGNDSARLWNGQAAAGLFQGKAYSQVWIDSVNTIATKLQTQGLS